MTRNEYDKTKWEKGTTIHVGQKSHKVHAVNFDNRCVSIQHRNKIIAIPYYNLELKIKCQ